MIRTQVYLTHEEREGLISISKELNLPVSTLIRKAIDRFLIEERADWKEDILALAGIWKNRDDLPDFESIRKEGDRLAVPIDPS